MVAALEVVDAVRPRAEGIPLPLGPAVEAERSIPFEGALRSPGLGSPRQLVAVGGIGKSSFPNSSAPCAAPGKEPGVKGKLSGRGGAGEWGKLNG